MERTAAILHAAYSTLCCRRPGDIDFDAYRVSVACVEATPSMLQNRQLSEAIADDGDTRSILHVEYNRTQSAQQLNEIEKPKKKLVQISRYGYKNLDDMMGIIGRNVKAGIPLDTVVADIDYMDRYKDFTTGDVIISQENSRNSRIIIFFSGLRAGKAYQIMSQNFTVKECDPFSFTIPLFKWTTTLLREDWMRYFKL